MTVAWPALAGLAALVGGLALWVWRQRRELARLRQRLREAAADLEHLQRTFSRFAPDEVVERVIADGVSTHGERKEVTVLFADLVGYTALSGKVEPPVLVRILNGYFERMSRAISDHSGHVTTFIGDGILALFGALAPNPWQANDAAHAALAMRGELASYNRELSAEGLPTLAIGVGLHRGSGVVGLVGSRDRMEFAFVGRVVNLAARVQEITRRYPADVIVTTAVKETLDPRFIVRALPPTLVKGVAEQLTIYALEGFAPRPGG